MRNGHRMDRKFLRQVSTVGVAIVGATAASLAGIGASGAQPPADLLIKPNTMIVLDLSGSMNQLSSNGNVKLKAVAQRTAAEILRRSGQSHRTGKTGFVVFGHRKENGLKPRRDEAQVARSCQDIKVFSGPTENARQRMDGFANLVSAIPNAKGQTPILESIKIAASYLSGGGSILLITDLDKEVCKPITPCEEKWGKIIDEHRSKGIFVRHIVAVSKDRSNVGAIKELSECLDSNLHNVTSLGDAGKVATEIVADQVTISTPARLRLSYAYLGTPQILPRPGSGAGRAEVKIAGRTTTKDLHLDGPDIKKTTQLPPGEHDVRLNLSDEAYHHTIELVRGKLKGHAFRIPTHQVKFRVVGYEGRPIPDDPQTQWIVAGFGGQISRISGNTLGLELAPGSYSATVDVRGVVGRKQFKVSADRRPAGVEVMLAGLTALPTTPEPSRATLDVVLGADVTLFGERLEDTLKLRLTPQSGSAVPIATRSGGALSVTPGTYRVDLVVNAKSVPAGSHTFRAGEPYNVKIQYGGEALSAATNKPTTDTVWTVTDQDGNSHSFAGADLYQTVPPGTYSVTATRNGVTKTSTITLPATQSSNQKRVNFEFD